MVKSNNKAIRAITQRLESLQEAGVTHVRKMPKKTAGTENKAAIVPKSPRKNAPAAPTEQLPTQLPSLPPSAPLPKSPVAQIADRQAALAEVAKRVAACTRCAELARTRTQTVFGVGNPYARLAFLGEAPGADEDRQGEPFVGAAGQLLNKIIQACTLRREDVYILNILRCRPPGNRNPLPVEAAACREYLDAQLAIIQPEFICCLGAVAAQNLLQSTLTIGQMRGRFHDYGGIRVLCTYHPAYLLRNPSAKKATWDDMKLLLAEMGIKIPGEKG
jgi:uracil-DNA glycosylase